MEEKNITEEIRELKADIEKTDLRNIPAKQLAKYLVKVDRLKALMNAYENMRANETLTKDVEKEDISDSDNR